MPEFLPDFHTWTYLLTIACAFHFALFSIILFFKKGKNPANKVLAFFIFSIAYVHFFHLLYLNKQVYTYYHVVNFGAIFVSLFAPSLWIYVKFMTEEKIIINRASLLHFLPILPALYLFVSFFFYSPSEIKHLIDLTYTHMPWPYKLIDVVVFLQMNYYWFVSLKVLKRYKQAGAYTTAATTNLRWLKQVIWFFIYANYIMLTYCIVENDFLKVISYFPYFTLIPYILLIYKSLNHSFIFNSPITDYISVDFLNRKRVKRVYKNDFDEESITLYRRIYDYFEQQEPYLNCDLSAKEVADYIGISTHQLSFVLNGIGKKNFFDFVNSFRIKRAKDLLLKEEFKVFKIESIAYQSGFGSKSRFNDIFRKQCQVTPSDFRKSHNSLIIKDRET